MPGAAGSFDVKLLAAFDVCFCLAMNLLNPSLSTNKLFSLAISAVRSNGNPNVSWSLKITSPGIVLSLIFKIASSRILIPFSKVSKNFNSSSLIVLIIDV